MLSCSESVARAAMESVLSCRHSSSVSELGCAARCARLVHAEHLNCTDLINTFDGRGRIVRGRGAAPLERLMTASFEPRVFEGLRFVCFCGTLRQPDTSCEERWKCDERLCNEMAKLDFAYYVSVPFDASAAESSDWFNLVLFSDVGFVKDFKQSNTHTYAREFLSGESFTNVCVRQGQIGLSVGGGGILFYFSIYSYN